ncbi:MAG: flavodoxin domain-containing protein [Planctomycetes bacterium]|nr:flavodoxin domain-containing protein [Planctomycetota bacterium]
MTVRIAIVFASSGGNTLETARMAALGATEAGAVTALYSARDFSADILTEHDGLLIGEPTWGQGDHHADFRPFDDSMAQLLAPARRLHGKGAAAFAGCDRAYRNFGRAIELIEKRLAECGAEILQRGLMIELRHNPASREFTQQWGRNFVARLRGELAPEAHEPRMGRAEVDRVMGISLAERESRELGGLR